jgi:hypothetical protein|tara:strand:- start:1624 stop:1791 length:168 start_codon:yes stop_codon:yes gene_type:complete
LYCFSKKKNAKKKLKKKKIKKGRLKILLYLKSALELVINRSIKARGIAKELKAKI